MTELVVKDPDETLDYVVDFAPLTNERSGATSDWLVTGDALASAVVTAATGITVSTSTITDSATSVTVWLSGGTAGTTYNVEVDVTTNAGRVGSRSFNVLIESQ